MDPNLFHLDWGRLTEVLSAIVVLSFLVERMLSLVTENEKFIDYLSQSGLKEFLAFVVSLGICYWWDFDAVSMIILREHTHFLGYVVTAGVIAGGSKGAIKLFHDVLHWKNDAMKRRDPETREASVPSPPPPSS